MPPAGDVAVVAPVITQVRSVTMQLSATIAFATATDAVQTPGSVFVLIFAGQVIVGFSVSLSKGLLL